MNGAWLLTKAELNRLRNNKRYFFFTLLLPVVLYLALGRNKWNIDGTSFAVEYMLAMGMMGAFSGALSGNAQRISQEKKDGWIRQLRLTPLPANAYVVAKIAVSMATTIPSVLIVLLLGRFYGNVHLPVWQWAVLAVTIWFGSTIFAALAVALGYKISPEQVQPVTMILYFGFAILGGLWFPLPGIMHTIGEALPTGAVIRICSDVVQGAVIPVGVIAALIAWCVVFAGLATAAVRTTGENI
jgi:ABC-2 type transport system permease protein